ncbi:unnamed protein product, partial [Cuscuta epithymum]
MEGIPSSELYRTDKPKDDYDLMQLIKIKDYDPVIAAKGYSSDGDGGFIDNLQSWKTGQEKLTQKLKALMDNMPQKSDADLMENLERKGIVQQDGFITVARKKKKKQPTQVVPDTPRLTRNAAKKL